MRTRVGYAGGTKEKPTYRSMGDHTEAVSIDYDPAVTSYEDLLGEFWLGHRCDSLNHSRQYMKAVFYRDEQQRQAALESRDREAHRLGLGTEEVRTEVLPVNAFTYAEGYHQKYVLSRKGEIRLFLEQLYPTAKALADSTVATRLNAYLGSGLKLDWAAFAEELPEYKLPEFVAGRLQVMAESRR
ncbi:peptide-methionine (S)-S-oxide reductase [Roseibacillus ishigakijimensis]|uniref:peptide-methionine (S)-S-oxide reductase n=1 Tax=Roseibacillus ishigakijimensis TaxID=454146 RepID=A0A934RUB7_9BACT|nr:peptide-methionine (S)-S-oxide reductase [Roseibacillus ishigakijimensis]